MNFTDNILENNGVYEIGEFNLEELLPNLSDLFTEDTVVNGANLSGRMTNVKINIYSSEGEDVPHFHIHSDDKKVMPNGDCCIMICEARYFQHGRHQGKLNNNQAKTLNKLLNTPYPKNRRITIWKHIWSFWHDNLNNNIKECDQPDYSLLNNY